MKALASLILIVSAFASLSACSGREPASLDAANAAIASQNYEEARSSLFEVLESQPENLDALQMLARAEIALGDADAADRAISRFAAAGGKVGVLNRLKAGAVLLRGNPKGAIALIVNDFDTDAWRLRGEAYLAMGERSAAAQAFEKGMSAGDDLPLAVAYARFALENNDLALVEKILLRIQIFAKDSYNEFVLAGDLASAQGETGQAIAAYRRTIAAYPSRIDPMLALAETYGSQGKSGDAMALVDKAAKVKPSDPRIENLRIRLLAQQGDWDKIRLSLQGREGGLGPASPLGLAYGEALLRLGQAEQARVLFSRAALLDPANPYCRAMLGEALLATGDASGAWETLEPLSASQLAPAALLVVAEKAARASGDPKAQALRARLDPQRIRVAMDLVEKGQAALDRQNWSEAHSIYSRLLAGGEDAEVLGRLAWASAGLGRSREAIAYADRALAQDADNPAYMHSAALVRLELGVDLATARRLLEAAADADPRNADIARDLQKAKAAAG
ncbi:tetratricopeptide repeat protein [Novosphingobium sp.]|uniref:tetratricopeptide repeat protein n=1 Tax=Novosphingobium sp. TaxID=1874826 RepID=UPI0028A845C5|nr:tetratricopeptide repeat protein [Novosphingobium sp.]